MDIPNQFSLLALPFALASATILKERPRLTGLPLEVSIVIGMLDVKGLLGELRSSIEVIKRNFEGVDEQLWG